MKMYRPEDFDVIDMHTHPFLTPDQVIGQFWKPDSIADFVREMAKVGIHKFAGSVIYNTCGNYDFKSITKLNNDALRIRDMYPDAYIPGIHIHGAYPQESCAMLHKMHAQGVRMIGELVPYILGTGEYASDGMIEICREAEKIGMLVSVHGHVGETLVPVLQACPKLKVIMAHPGDTAEAKARFDFVSRYDNLYIDISGTGLFRWGMLRYGVDVCGAEKILFGSDMPVCSPGMNLFGALSENLTFEELKLVLGDNFRNMLNAAG